MSISDDEVEAAGAAIWDSLVGPGIRLTRDDVTNYSDAARAALSAAAKVRAIREHATSSNGVGGFGPTPTIDPVFSSDIETMTPTDNLEAGAGDLVAELNRIADMAAETIDTGGREEFDPRGIEDVLREAAAQLASVTAENARLREALEPFAEAAGALADDHRDGSPIWETAAAMGIDAVHLRAARAALSQEPSHG